MNSGEKDQPGAGAQPATGTEVIAGATPAITGTREEPRPAFAAGHFYSPVVDPAELRAREQEIWDPLPIEEGSPVDYRPAAQRELLAALGRYAPDYDTFLELAGALPRPAFVEPNGMFGGLDARVWFCLLRHFRPRRVVEIGSGYTSLLAAEVNRRVLDQSAELVCIDPYPPAFLAPPIPGLSELRAQPVQEVPLALFARLEAGDILFVDSSHVAKTGSDVNHIYFRILPVLERGVILHVHDIFLPGEYPRDWVLGEQRSWNEQYLVHALLSYSHGLEILFGCAFATRFFPELIRSTFGRDCGGSSLWLRKTARRSGSTGVR